jgi:hypothetical protein
MNLWSLKRGWVQPPPLGADARGLATHNCPHRQDLRRQMVTFG